MIISRAPLRLTLGGGGTDLPSYYEEYGGFLIAGAIDKHVYVGTNHQFYDNYSLKYSKIEVKEELDQIEHKLIRAVLMQLGIHKGIEITSLADIPSGTGLGSSGAFLVALLNTLHEYKGYHCTKRELAEEACEIELDILKEHEGKQDKFASSFGGIKAYEFHKNGSVSVIPLANEDLIISELKQKLFLFFTEEKRRGITSDVLKEQDESIKNKDTDIIERLHMIKKIGIKTKEVLEKCEFDKFGELLNQHWEIKKQYSPTSTSKQINRWYQIALNNGAIGGKIMGAGGGGGFFMFYHPGPIKEQWTFVENMTKEGLHPMEFSFDNEGIITITN